MDWSFGINPLRRRVGTGSLSGEPSGLQSSNEHRLPEVVGRMQACENGDRVKGTSYGSGCGIVFLPLFGNINSSALFLIRSFQAQLNSLPIGMLRRSKY